MGTEALALLLIGLGIFLLVGVMDLVVHAIAWLLDWEE